MNFVPYSDEWIEYVLKLEKERYGSSVTDVPSKESLDSKQVKRIREHFEKELAQLEALQVQRDKIFFNAGRFMAGDRDDTARAAKSLMDVLLEQE